MSGQAFSHPNFGSEAKVETFKRRDGRGEARLTFVANTPAQADDLAEKIVEQLKAGALHLTMMGKPTSVVEE